jgi:hypothetical protein
MSLVVAAAAVCFLFVLTACTAPVYVTPTGDDDAPGTRRRPLASLRGARDAVRRLREAGPTGDITVWFAGGTYRLDETVVFGPADSAPDGSNVVYSALPGHCPVFSSGVRITGWRKLTSYPEALPAKVRGKVYVADSPDGLDRIHTLFEGERRLPLARCKGFIPPQEEDIGGAGVLLAGYGPGTKDVNRRNRIVNNDIHHVGQTYWHSAAIFTWQSGENLIAHNHIHHTPYTAIVVSGRIGMDPSGRSECSKTVRWKEAREVLGGRGGSWKQREPLLHSRKNIVEYNDIHDVMEVLEDGNCVYVSGCGGGNVVRYNWLHNCESIHMAEGIRCDDDQHETIIHGNVLWRIGGLATYIAIKGVNHVTNNIMACPVRATYRGMLSLECAPVAGSLVQRNIFYAVNRNDIPCYQGMTYYRNIARLADCQADFNVYHNTADPAWGFRHLHRERGNGIEAHSLPVDPMFLDAENGELRLEKGSAAWKLGFEPIDMARMGLQGKVGPAAVDKQ